MQTCSLCPRLFCLIVLRMGIDNYLLFVLAVSLSCAGY